MSINPQRDILLQHLGGVDADTFKMLQLKLSEVLSQNVSSVLNRKRAFSVFYELLSNLMKHSWSHHNNETILLVESSPKTLYFATKNAVNSETLQKLRERLDALSTLSKAQLKKAYLKSLEEAPVNFEGAGLGLIIIFMKCNMVYTEIETKNGIAMFHIRTELNTH